MLEDPKPQVRNIFSNDLVDKKTKRSQAQRIVAKFGGARRLYHLLQIIDPTFVAYPSTIYRWTYPRNRKGTDGIIPTKAIPYILKAARLEGIILTPEDLYPGDR